MPCLDKRSLKAVHHWINFTRRGTHNGTDSVALEAVNASQNFMDGMVSLDTLRASIFSAEYVVPCFFVHNQSCATFMRLAACTRMLLLHRFRPTLAILNLNDDSCLRPL